MKNVMFSCAATKRMLFKTGCLREHAPSFAPQTGGGNIRDFAPLGTRIDGYTAVVNHCFGRIRALREHVPPGGITVIDGSRGSSSAFGNMLHRITADWRRCSAYQNVPPRRTQDFFLYNKNLPRRQVFSVPGISAVSACIRRGLSQTTLVS